MVNTEQTVYAAMTDALSWVCVVIAGLSWVPWLLCTTGVQPHPVQSVWLRPGEAVDQLATTHTPQMIIMIMKIW